MPVKLKRLDVVTKDIVLPVGNTVLGRGQLLQCGDKRISRNHADLNCDINNKVFLTPLHVNPCFKHKSGSSETLIKDKIVELAEDDIFSLLPDKFQYKIVLCSRDDVTEQIEDDTTDGNSKQNAKNGKRVLPGWMSNCDTPSKTKKLTHKKSDNITKSTSKSPVKSKIRTVKPESSDDDEQSDTSKTKKLMSSKADNNTKSTSKSAVKSKTRNLKPESSDDDDGEQSCADAATSSDNKNVTNNAMESEDELENNDSSSDQDAEVNSMASGCKVTSVREPCMYGSKCYRKNPTHTREFSHPGDSDYASTDDNDDRPECSYGIRCYRKNAKHKKMFKHSRKVQPKRSAAKNNQNYDFGSSDEDDIEDIDDSLDDSEAYNPDSDSD